MIIIWVVLTISIVRAATEDVVFKPQYRGGARYGTAFFISPDGYFLATNHGFEKCKNNDIEASYYDQALECPTYEGMYRGESYDLSLIAYPDFGSSDGLTLAESFRRKDFLLGKLSLAPGQQVSYVDLTAENPLFKYQKARIIAGITINAFAPAAKNVVVPGFSGGELVVVHSKLIGKHHDYGYLMSITNNPELQGGASGSPVFDQEGNFLGLLCAKGEKVAVILAKNKILDGLMGIAPEIEAILMGTWPIY